MLGPGYQQSTQHGSLSLVVRLGFLREQRGPVFVGLLHIFSLGLPHHFASDCVALTVSIVEHSFAQPNDVAQVKSPVKATNRETITIPVFKPSFALANRVTKQRPTLTSSLDRYAIVVSHSQTLQRSSNLKAFVLTVVVAVL